MKIILPEALQEIAELSLQQFIPRGSQVRQSGQLFLLVIYTGKDTKQILNEGNYKFK